MVITSPSGGIETPNALDREHPGLNSRTVGSNIKSTRSARFLRDIPSVRSTDIWLPSEYLSQDSNRKGNEGSVP